MSDRRQEGGIQETSRWTPDRSHRHDHQFRNRIQNRIKMNTSRNLLNSYACSAVHEKERHRDCIPRPQADRGIGNHFEEIAVFLATTYDGRIMTGIAELQMSPIASSSSFCVSAATMQGIHMSHIRMEMIILFIGLILRSFTFGGKITKKILSPKYFSLLAAFYLVIQLSQVRPEGAAAVRVSF